ncbi:hypothetical protein DL240_18705 [Lujinxingia litoralis]|uniref:Outer membrane protein beta-barrel domain-containing protein n=2 Tax=Lujinxingia litoralis TaxID=2211119 RepID=A0A328C2X1_9DELT|nr:hypothetical protein DL240_18705 [Lujinxingia litoralis]
MCGALACLLGPVEASALEWGQAEVGARVGGSFGWLYRPVDPVGAPTLLYGTAFRGMGLVVGPTLRQPLWEGSGARVSLVADALYGYQSGRGHAEDVDSGERLEMRMAAHSLRVPLLLELSNGREAGGLSLGVGPELLVGLASQATLEESSPEGSSSTPMNSRAPSALGAALALGYTLDRGEFKVPLMLSASWNPFVAESTFERFEGYQSFASPGRYTVAFNWQLFMSAGVRWSLDELTR